MTKIILGMPITEEMLIAALPGTHGEICQKLFSSLTPEQRMECVQLTPNVIGLILQKNAKRLGLKHSIIEQHNRVSTYKVNYWS